MKYGALAFKYSKQKVSLEILQGHDGFYIGTKNGEGKPLSRESVETWRKKQTADMALTTSTWTQRTSQK
jgi:hypothetical protein